MTEFSNDEGLMDKELLDEYDEADGSHNGICRSCNKWSNCVSNDDGYCGDCN